MTSPGARLRAAWSARPIMIPGAFNALTAKLAERLGFAAVYLSGGALSAGWAGVPDIGLLTLTEFAEQAVALVNKRCVQGHGADAALVGQPVDSVGERCRPFDEHRRGPMGLHPSPDVSSARRAVMANRLR